MKNYCSLARISVISFPLCPKIQQNGSYGVLTVTNYSRLTSGQSNRTYGSLTIHTYRVQLLTFNWIQDIKTPVHVYFVRSVESIAEVQEFVWCMSVC